MKPYAAIRIYCTSCKLATKKKGTYNLLSLAVHSTNRVKVKAWTIFTNMGQVHMPN